MPLDDPILVTGASGELGGVVLPRLATLGRPLRVLSRRGSSSPSTAGTAPGGIETVVGDLRDPASLDRACRGVGSVVHLAAVTHARRPRDYFETNTEGTRSLVAAAERAGVGRFVHLGTRAVGAEGGAYAHSKALAEQAVTGASIPWVVLRPAEVYGAGDGGAIAALARSLVARPFVPILGDGRYRMSPVHAADVVTALVAALERPAAIGRTYVLAGPEELTYLELVERLEGILGLTRRRRIRVPLGLARLGITIASALGLGPYVPDQIPRLLMGKDTDAGKAADDLGFAPRTLAEGLSLRDPGARKA